MDGDLIFDWVMLIGGAVAAAFAFYGVEPITNFLKDKLNISGKWALLLSLLVSVIGGLVIAMGEGAANPAYTHGFNVFLNMLGVFVGSQVMYGHNRRNDAN